MNTQLHMSTSKSTPTSALYCSEIVDGTPDSTPAFAPSSSLVNTIEAKLAELCYGIGNTYAFSFDSRDGFHCFTVTCGTASTQVVYVLEEYSPEELKYVGRPIADVTMEGVLEPTDPRIVEALSLWLRDVDIISQPVCSLKHSPSRHHEGPCDPTPEKCKNCWNTWCGVCGDGLPNYGGGCCVLPRVKALPTKYATIDAAIRKSASKHKWSDEETTQSIAVLTALVEPFKSRLQKLSGEPLMFRSCVNDIDGHFLLVYGGQFEYMKIIASPEGPFTKEIKCWGTTNKAIGPHSEMEVTLQADGSIYLVDIGIVTDVKYTTHNGVLLSEEILNAIIP